MKTKRWLCTGCSLNIVFFSKILKYILDSGLSRLPLGVSVCTQWQVKHQRCSSRTCWVQKNRNILRKTQYSMSTLYVISWLIYDKISSLLETIEFTFIFNECVHNSVLLLPSTTCSSSFIYDWAFFLLCLPDTVFFASTWWYCCINNWMY